MKEIRQCIQCKKWYKKEDLTEIDTGNYQYSSDRYANIKKITFAHICNYCYKWIFKEEPKK